MHTNEFTNGMVQTLKGYESTNKHVEVEIDFLTNRLEVHQEYLVYDFESIAALAHNLATTVFQVAVTVRFMDSFIISL